MSKSLPQPTCEQIRYFDFAAVSPTRGLEDKWAEEWIIDSHRVKF